MRGVPSDHICIKRTIYTINYDYLYYSWFTADAIRVHDVTGHKFSTFDHDDTRRNCPLDHGSGWWYDDCTLSNLNAPLFLSHVDPMWYTFLPAGSDCRMTEMLIKRNK